MKEYSFNAKEITENLIVWIRNWFEQNGKDCNAVLGLSGGKDSTIMAALCVKALGADRVIGVAMPDGKQGLDEADDIAKFLGIRFLIAPITEITSSLKRLFAMGKTEDKYPWWFDMSKQAEQNIPPRARMMTLYAISQSNNGRVMGTCNLSEDIIGYFTLHGDGASDVEPLGNLTVTEILQIGDELGLPKEWVHKKPNDGLPNSMADEEKFGFSYTDLDKYIRGLGKVSTEIREKITRMIKNNAFKLRPKSKFEF